MWPTEALDRALTDSYWKDIPHRRRLWFTGGAKAVKSLFRRYLKPRTGKSFENCLTFLSQKFVFACIKAQEKARNCLTLFFAASQGERRISAFRSQNCLTLLSPHTC